MGLWDEMDGFFYDVLRLPDGRKHPMRIRSMVGLIPLFAVETLEPELLDRLPGFKRRLEWFIDNRRDLVGNVACMRTRGKGERRLLSIIGGDQLRRVLQLMLDENEFFVALWYSCVIAISQRSSVHTGGERNGVSRQLRASRIEHRPLRRKFQLARTDLVPDELSAD